MKKTSKAKRTARNYYTPGRNIFGEKVETQLIILKKETAFQQIMDATCQLDDGVPREFTYDASCFIGNMDEFMDIMKKVIALVSLREEMANRNLTLIA